MKEEKKLMNLNLEDENKKLKNIQVSGIKLYFFDFVHYLLQNHMENYFLDYTLIICQFIQLMAFPMDSVFSSGWKSLWFQTVGNFFHYFQSFFIFNDYSNFYTISFLISWLYIIIFIILISLSILQLQRYSKITKNISELVYILIQLNTIVSLPFLKILIKAFSCTDDNNLINGNSKCKSPFHIIIIVVSCILIIPYFILLILLKMICFEFGDNPHKLKAAFTSSTEVLLILVKLILVIIYKFITNSIILSIVNLLLSTFIFFDYYGKQPFINRYLNKVYLAMYLLFLWTNFICFFSLILKNTKFEGAVLLLLLGYPFLILLIIIREIEFTFGKIFEFDEDKYKNGYKNLIRIEYFLKLEESLYDKIRTREHKLLYSYIENYEESCTNEQCGLKIFLKIPLKVENFQDMKKYLFRHAEILYKVAISKYPFNIKLRLSYGLFLYNKMNKREQGENEIFLLSKFQTNFEDSFLVFRAQKIIENNNSGVSLSSINMEYVKNLKYKPILNNIKALMTKIVNKYIDFWTIIIQNDKINNTNLAKINFIGNNIIKLNENLISNVDVVEKATLYDLDLIKIYYIYLSEILNDHSTANMFKSRIYELENAKHQFDEDNVFNLDYKEMAKSEDYKYIIINCSQDKLGIIKDMSISTSLLFGFSKDELIGRPLDYILPELFIFSHKKLLLEKIEKFKKNQALNNINNHSDCKVYETFGRNKMKYLVPIKLKNILVSSEEGELLGISRIITDNYLKNNKEQEIAYVLTDQNFMINSFTSNSINLLNFQISSSNLNLDITKYISELNKDLYLCEEYDDSKKSKINGQHENKNLESFRKKILQKKTNLISKLFLNNNNKKLITWNIFDIYGKPPENSKISKYYRTSLTEGFDCYHKGEDEDFSNENKNNNLYKSFNLRVTNEKNNKDLNNDDNVIIRHDKITDSIYVKKLLKKFYMTIKEINIGEIKVGYIFKFELIKKNNYPFFSVGSSILPPNKNKSRISVQSDNEKSDNSEISFIPKKKIEQKKIIFHVISGDENQAKIDLGLDFSFIPKLDKEKEFFFDAERMSYKQYDLIGTNKLQNVSNNILREQAEQKVIKFQENKNEEEEDEESEESSSSFTLSSGDSLEDHDINKPSYFIPTKIKEKKSKVENHENIIIINSNSNNLNNNLNNDIDNHSLRYSTTNIKHNQKSKDINNDFYHINLEKITLFVYNFSTGFLETIKDPKFKISQMTSQMRMHKEIIGKSNSIYIANPKLANKEKKKNFINSLKKSDISESEINSLNEKKLKLEIEKALTSKENQSSTTNLYFFSFIIFIVIIGSSLLNVLYNILMKENIIIYYYFVEKSIFLYQDILHEIFFVREMISLSDIDYINIYQNDKNLDYLNISSKCEQLYLETSSILSNLSTSINRLNQKQKNNILNKKGNLVMIDKIHSTNSFTNFRNYELLAYSAFHEINAALYHISQMNIENVNEYDENIFYFLRNSLNFGIKMVRDQIDFIMEEFYNEIKREKYYLFACVVASIIIYILCYLCFIYFYSKVENKKKNYLSIVDDIGKEYILDSLEKCEKFTQKVYLKDETKDDASINSTIKDKEDSIKKKDLSSKNILKSIKEINKTNSSKRKREKIKIHSNQIIIVFIIFLVLFLIQLIAYIYYFINLNTYKKYLQYGYYNIQYYSLFLIPFLILREYLFLSNNTIMGIEIPKYIEITLKNYYMDLNNILEIRNIYNQYLPLIYSEYIDDLYNKRQCSFLEAVISEYQNMEYKSCDSFFYNISYYGFESITMRFIEDIRSTYHQSLKIFNDENNEILKRNKIKQIFLDEKYKMNVIIYRFVIIEVIKQSLEKLFENFYLIFDDVMKFSLVINIIFISAFIVGFIVIWLLFVFGENETLYKTKKMISIIPRDILLNLPNIKPKLGIEAEN